MTYNPTDPKLAWLRNLFMIRTTIRRRVAAQNEMSRLAIALERKAKLLDGGAAVDAFLAQSYREAAAMLREEFRALYPVSLKEYGKLLMEIAPYIDHFTTLEERCEALNVNIADRGELTEKDGVLEIIFAHRARRLCGAPPQRSQLRQTAVPSTGARLHRFHAKYAGRTRGG